jgi:hypothetical protein
MTIPSQRTTRRRPPSSSLLATAISLFLIAHSTLAYPSHPIPRYLSKGQVFQNLPNLPGGYLAQLSTKHKLQECSLSTTKCGPMNSYQFCASGCCSYNGNCEHAAYCPDNGTMDYNLKGFNECVYNLLDANEGSPAYLAEVKNVGSFEKDAKVAMLTCPANKSQCGKIFEDKFCTVGCCSNSGYCGTSQIYCVGNYNQHYDSDQLSKCLEDIGTNAPANKNDGSPKKEFEKANPPADKAQDPTPIPKEESPKPKKETPKEETPIPPPIKEVSTHAEDTVTVTDANEPFPLEDPSPDTEPQTMNRKIHDLVYSLMFLSIFAIVATYYILPGIIYCCYLRKKMVNAKFNKSRCFLTCLTIFSPWIMVILMVKAVYKKRYIDMVADRVIAKGPRDSVDIREYFFRKKTNLKFSFSPKLKEKAKDNDAEGDSIPAFVIGGKYDPSDPDSPCQMKTSSDKIPRRESMRRDTFKETQKNSDLSDKYQLGESNALQIYSIQIKDSDAHLGWLKQENLGTMAEMSRIDSPSK